MKRGKKILIVEDEEGMRQTLTDILSEEGYEVSQAEDGFQALKKVKEMKSVNQHFQLALVDIRMPGINGVQTFKEIKKISPHTDVIMVTAYAVEEEIEEAIREGAFAIFHKPLDFKRLTSHIEKALKDVVVLIVDDRLEEIEVLKDLFEYKGYKVAMAKDGPEAIKKVRKDGFKIAIIDIKMPLINGVETLRKIKEIEPKLPVIMVTGYSVEELIKEALRINAYTCLYKPFDLHEVLRVISEVRRGEAKKVIKP